MRWIGSPDHVKARIWRQAAKRVDYVSEFARIKNEASAIKASNDKPRRIERKLEELRREWQSLRRQQVFAETGVTVL